MGLDMYLYSKKYISKYSGEKYQDKLEKLRAMFPEIKTTGNLDSVWVSFEAGYWRKANHIHNWFVENVQDGVDNCGNYYVSEDDLIKLKELCIEVNKYLDSCEKKYDEEHNEYYSFIVDKNKINDLLPTKSGFFFGGVEYDKWYYKDNEDTIKIIDYCLSIANEWDLEYHSSW